MEFLFLNNALNHFLQTIQNVWAPVFQMHGIAMLLALSAVAFCVYMIQFGFTGDAPSFIIGMAYTVLALAVLHAIFIYSQQFAEDVLNGFITWGQETSGMSPAVLTPSGIMETGLQLARIFWTAGGHASWFIQPIAAIEIVICTIVVCVTFGVAAIVYLIALVEVWALIIAASVFLACAAMPWTWSMFPGWGLTVLSTCVRIFFLLCVLAIGLAEATAWTEAMAATSGTISDNLSLMMQATIESLLFIGLVYYIPRLMARMVVGAADTMMHAGEAVLASIAGLAASKAGSAALSAPRTAGNVIAQGVSTVKTVSQMLLR